MASRGRSVKEAVEVVFTMGDDSSIMWSRNMEMEFMMIKMTMVVSSGSGYGSD